jgi:hypothetical protein
MEKITRPSTIMEVSGPCKINSDRTFEIVKSVGHKASIGMLDGPIKLLMGLHREMSGQKWSVCLAEEHVSEASSYLLDALMVLNGSVINTKLKCVDEWFGGSFCHEIVVVFKDGAHGTFTFTREEALMEPHCGWLNKSVHVVLFCGPHT